MNSLDELIVTIGKTLAANSVDNTHGKSELITLAVTLAEKLVAGGHTKVEYFTVDFFDDRWFEMIYNRIYPEAETSIEETATTYEFSEALELNENPDSENGPEETPALASYSYDDFDLTVPETLPEDELEAPGPPKIRYADKAERKQLDKEKAAAEAPAWAVLKPLGSDPKV